LKGTLKRKLNLLDLFFLGIGSIIGSGWLYGAQKGANIAGSLSWISWIIGAFIIILIGLVYAELGAAMPRAGGFVRYPDYSHGSVVGFFIGFTSMLAYSAVIAVEVEAVRGYAQYWWPGLGEPSGAPTAIGFLFQGVLILVFFLLNYWSVNIFGKTNTVITFIKFVVPALIIIFLLMHMDVNNFSVQGATPGGLKGIFTAVTGAGIVFAFNGFRQPIEFAGEAKNPQRDIPRAIIYSVLVGLVVYLLLQFAFLGAVPHDMLTGGGWVSIKFDSPWAGLGAALGLGWLVNLVLLDAVISPSATGNIYFSATARSLFAWAKTGTFYKIFQKIDPRTGLPRGALWLTLVMAILWMSPAQFQQWSGLISASTSAKALTFMVGPISLISFRKSLPNMERPFFLRAAHIIAPLAFIASTLVVYWSGWKVVSILIPIIIPSIVFYFAFVDKNDYFRGKVRGDLTAALWLIGYYLFLFVFSLLGGYGPYKIIPSPWDTVVVALLSLVFYYWGTQTALANPRIDHDDDEMEE
jgi:amino acid transporter